VAIVGTSGSGKSTILRLLYRFYEVDGGRILVDGQEIRDLTLDSLREVIGVVPQDTPLLHADIMHNVRYGRLDATDEEVKEACRRAHVADTIESLPEKYHTKVGERGLMISGGEKQRYASLLQARPTRAATDPLLAFVSQTRGRPRAAEGPADPLL
jgi:ATP-binding cassette subfamily B (MDR/TAP) protein 7